MMERPLSGVSGVSVALPRLTRVRPVDHATYAGSTLTYDAERGDYELLKLETVPGLREDDPLAGAKVALPPASYRWDAAALLWVHRSTGEPYAGMARRKFPGGAVALPEAVGSRPIAWTWDDAPAAPRRGAVTAHEADVGDDLGSRGAWTVALDAGRRGPRDALRAPELRAALDLRHHLDCRGEPPALSAELADEGWSAKQSRSTGDWYYVYTGPGGAATSQWERPGCGWANAPSCACEGHRTSTRVDSHVDRMERKASLAQSCLAKYGDYEAAQEARGAAAAAAGDDAAGALQTYAEWCRARCEAYYECPANLRHLAEDHADRRADLAGHVETMYGLMREYDHVASDSDFSDDDDSEGDDDSGDLLDHDFEDVARRHKKKRKTEKIIREGIEAFIDSPGVASRILHGDGYNRTRSGRLFGGDPKGAGLRKHLDFD